MSEIPMGKPIKRLTPEEAAEREAKTRANLEAAAVQREKEAAEAVPRAIAKLREEAAQKLAEADQIEQALKLFPDLKRYVGRWEKVAYYSKQANTQVTTYESRHNCGCCADSPLEVWPYLETPVGKVYSDPPSFQVGEKHWISGDKPYPGWRGKLEAAGLPATIVNAVQEYFKQCQEERVRAASEEGPDSDEPEMESLDL